ncbi:MAG: cytochrome c oxidase subunit II [Anaerolineae bacterium]|nr:cytochrome c oxidase subunit II [Anaerolineae bacterium]
MNHTNSDRWISGLALAGLILVMLAFPAHAWAHGPSEGGASNDDVNRLFRIVLWIAIPIFLLVEGLIVYSIIRFRRRTEDEMPEQVEGNTLLEITWTVMAFVIVTVLFLLTLRALQTDYNVVAGNEDTTPDLTVRVTGYMFNWDYEYVLGDSEETGVMTTLTMTIPAGKNVLLEITSTDVQHSFWVPDLAGKVDAIPGYINTMWLNASKPGLYTGNCAEFCGLNHYNMLIEVDVLESAAFDVWLAEQMAAASEFQPMGIDLESSMPAGDAVRGAGVFNELACNACHQPEENQPSGPSIKNMMHDALSMDEMTADAYLREAILMPCAQLAAGWDQCIMPGNYGERLDAQGLADLIEYIKTY